MTVRDIIAEPLRNFRIATGNDADRRVAEVLEVCGLGAAAMARYPHEFSGGQRQRIGIARALVLRPKLIVADEPVSSLDVSIQAQIVGLLQDLQAEFHLTYIFIAHDLSVVRHVSSRVAVMYLGRIVEIADADALYARPLHPYTRVLLSSVPVPDPDAESERRAIAVPGDIPSPLMPPGGCTFHTRCPWADTDICRRTRPALTEIDRDHFAACHFAGRLPALNGTRENSLERR
jgi:oligopeptide transport system ATP-binding protein